VANPEKPTHRCRRRKEWLLRQLNATHVFSSVS
jgi:hypothetical protein